MDECNHDKLYGSYYVDPGAVLGRFSAPFFAPMVRAFIERRRSVSFVDRR